MKKKSAQKWIWTHAKGELPSLVLLVLGNALFSVCEVSLALFAKGVIDAAQFGDYQKLVRYGLLLLCVVLLQIGLRVFNRSMEVRVAGRLEMRCKRQLFQTILQKDYSAVTAYHSGDLMTRMTADVTVVCDNITLLLPLAASMLTRLGCAFAVILSLDRWFGLLLAVAGVVAFFAARAFRGQMKKMHRSVQESDSRLRSFLQESIENLLVLQVFGIQQKARQQADVHQQENFDAKLRRNRWAIFANTGLSGLFSLGYLFALLWSGFRLYSGTITFGTLTALLQLVNQVQLPFSNLSGIMPKYYAMLSSAERIMEIETLPDDRIEDEGQKAPRPKTFGQLQFRDVSFAYGKNVVFEHADFTIHSGDFVVISGISGIGKSTLFKLLLGVLAPQNGRITVWADGSERPADKSTRPLFAYVPQGNLLLSGTVRDNVRLINADATDEELEEALRISCAQDFVRALPEGLDTMLGEGGRGLSEGQIQRLAVARAVLTNAPVLLLDEATSALDEATEQKLLENLRAMQNKTCIIISHKKAAFAICDRELEIADRCAQMRK